MLVILKEKRKQLCDNERDVLQLFGLELESRYNVISVDSGEECIEKYTEETRHGNKIHLILLDYKLGGIWGDSVARKINEYKGTNIILISAYDIDHSLVTELENGNYISKYVRKPVANDFLTDLVAEIVR
ncbi:MAG TPA: response regulator [Nitrososphaeraceae archaeon]|jgi:CheY-like chemotaxis protein|nr:response regulator [Nitrososphaeraceae archaeon]